MTAKSTSSDKKGVKKRSPYIPLVIIVVALSYILYLVADLYGLTDRVSSQFQGGSNTTQQTLLSNGTVEAKSSQPENQLGSRVRAKETKNTDLGDVPLLDVKSYDELASLHLLATRVRAEDKDAATLMGLQRISIHAKRQQAKEVELIKRISIDQAAATKAQKDANAYEPSGSSLNSNKSQNSDLPSPDTANIPSPDMDSNGDLGFNGFKLNDKTKEVEKITDIRLKGLSSKGAYITIKDRSYRNVKVGHTIAARFVFESANNELGCIVIKDNQADSLDTIESAQICLN